MKVVAIVLGLVMALINAFFKVLAFPFKFLTDSKADYLFQFNYGYRFCWIDLQFQKEAQSISGVELAHCYLQYLLKALNVMPAQSIPLVNECLEKGIHSNVGYMKITENIFGQVLVKSLTEMQRTLVMKVDFPGAVSSKNQEANIQWKHYFKIDKRPGQKVLFNFDSSPTDILLPLSCGLFYGYVIENLNPVEKQNLNNAILSILSEVKKESSLGISSYMKLSKSARQLI